MPIYFFHVHDGVSHVDTLGTELATLLDARNHAMRYFGDMIRDGRSECWDADQCSMEVTAGDGLRLFSLHFLGIESAATTAPLPLPGV